MMTKKRTWNYVLICVILFAVILAVISFFMRAENNIQQVYAGENVGLIKSDDIVLTGENGKTPYTYFDELTNAIHTDGFFYNNRNGTSTNQYRALTRYGTSIAGLSTGTAIINLTDDMKLLANTGHYFAYASAGLLARANETRNRVVIYLNANGNSVSATSSAVYYSGAYFPSWVSTNSQTLSTGTESVEFSFSTMTGAGPGVPAGFYIFEPMVSFGITIDQISTTLTNSAVASGQTVDLSASTFLDDISSNGELINYYKNLHKIEWEIVAGSDLGNIQNGKLNITGDSGIIQIRAKCLANSINGGYVYSEPITYTIDNYNYLNIDCNFNRGLNIIQGEGYFNAEQMTTDVVFSINSGYEFISVKDEQGNALAHNINGINYSIISVPLGQTVLVELRKVVSIADIVIQFEDKEYDGGVTAKINRIDLGIIDGHNVEIDNQIQATFENAIVGVNKNITITGFLSITGDNANWYTFVEGETEQTVLAATLSEQINMRGNIFKKDVLIKVDSAEKQYKQVDPDFTYTTEGIIDGHSFIGDISRQSGENVGVYNFTLGTLEVVDAGNNHISTNYNIVFYGNNFEIKRREVIINRIDITGKSYDKTVQVLADQINVQYNSTALGEGAELIVSAEYIDENVGDQNNLYRKEVIVDAMIIGVDKASYQLIMPTTKVYGAISPKELSIRANFASKTYTEADPEFTYEITNGTLCEGDSLIGKLAREVGEDAKSYAIQLGTLQADNYTINYTSANFTINKKNITVTANSMIKIYGEEDPVFTYRDTSVTAYPLNLTLTRVAGETVGSYNIIMPNASTYNTNYNVNFVGAQMSITARDISIRITPQNRQYNGQYETNFEYTISNDIDTDNLAISSTVVAKFVDPNYSQFSIHVDYYDGENLITEFSSSQISGSNINCYNPTFVVIFNAKIEPREVVLSIANDATLTKYYGDSDPLEIKYAVTNMPDGQTLTGKLSRMSGEEVDSYQILKGTLNQSNNPNYTITYDLSKRFVITKRPIRVETGNNIKTYGEVDPTITLTISEDTPLPTGVVFADIIKGSATRETGENFGEYNYLIGSIALKELSRYELTFNGGKLTIQKRTLSISVQTKSKTYGDNDPTLTYIITDGELLNNADLELNRIAGENVGGYTISATMLNDNYILTQMTAVLTINRAPITIKADNVSKIYGNPDPAFTYKITTGSLKFNDTMLGVFAGALSRNSGNNVGDYSINIGSLTIDGNYILTFESGVLTINTRPITVRALAVTKFIDEGTPTFTYTTTGLVGNDTLLGSLTVGPTDGVGQYDILLGTLSNSNYEITFISAKFTIKRRTLNIVVDYISKIYDGTINVEYTYQVNGDIKPGDTNDQFGITLNCTPQAQVGRYPITATSTNTEYIVNITNNYLEITKRPIIIRSNDVVITYGETVPDISTWTFNVLGGIINSEIQISGLTCDYTYKAGNYNIDINMTCSCPNNYNINYIAGKLIINKKVVQVTVPSYEKMYGETDPIFIYSLEEGGIINNDTVTGGITRRAGKSVGSYKLMSALVNSNYQFEINDAYLTITQRPVTLSVEALDKIYDGRITAKLGNVVIEGVLEGDSIDFEYTSAIFNDAEVGNNKAVTYTGGRLKGNAAANYSYTLPTNLSADITYKSMTSGNIKIYAQMDNTNLKMGNELVNQDLHLEEINDVFGNDDIIESYSVGLLDGTQEKASGAVTIQITTDLDNYNGIKVYMVDATGEKREVEYTYENGVISFETDQLGIVVITTEKTQTLMISLLSVGGGMALISLVCMIGIVINKNKGIKKVRT